MSSAQHVPIPRQKVSRIYIDTGIGLQFFATDSEVTVRIEGTIIRKADAGEWTITLSDPATVGLLVDRLAVELSEAVAQEDGTLVMTFVDGIRLIVKADRDYEAWEIAGPGKYGMVSLPGGGLDMWGLDDASAH